MDSVMCKSEFNIEFSNARFLKLDVERSYLDVLPVIFVFLMGLVLYYCQKRPRNFPPGPQWYPFVGNSLQLRRAAQNVGGTLAVYEKWKRQFNNPEVLGFRLGKRLTIVGISPKAVSQIHSSAVFDGRPKDYFTFIRTLYTYGGITFTDGNLWKEHRFFTIKHLKKLGLGFGSMYTQELLNNELEVFKSKIDQKMATVGTLWPGEFLRKSVTNVIWTILAGSDKDYYVQAEKLAKLLDNRVKFFDLTGGALSDFPWLRFIAPKYFGYNLLNGINSEIQSILQKIIYNHHRLYTPEKAAENFIYSYIREMKNQESNEKSTFTNSQLMVVLMDFIVGGSYENKVTLDLALMTLAMYPHIQEEIYEDVIRVSKSNPLHIMHSSDFPLVQAFILEVARFYNPFPFGGPRRTLEDTELCGYRIPKDTIVLIGSVFVHMNEELWGDPKVFRPWRFLNETRTKVNQTEHFYQFGHGRRKCLGFTLAKAFLHTFLIGLVHDYQITMDSDNVLPQQNLITGMFMSIRPYKVKFIKRF